MTTARSGLDRLLSPRSIAFIGASPTLDKAPMRVLDNLVRGGYQYPVYPVNPKYQEVFGFTCYPSLASLPQVPDVIAIAVAGHRLIGVLEEAGQLGVGAAVVYGATYLEPGVDSGDVERRIRDIAARTGLRILGPSSQGSFQVSSRACLSWSASYSGADLSDAGPIGWVSQSGAVGTALLGLTREVGVGLSHWVSTGNETDIEYSEVASHVLDDPATTALCGYVESIHDVAAFRAMCEKARSLGKPIVMLKGGMSEAGSAAASSHTGALASSSAVFEGFFRQCGVILAHDLDELVAIAWMIQHRPKLGRGGRAVMMCNSGGLGIVLTDLADFQGLSVVPFDSEVREAIRPLLPGFVEPGNPVDMPVVMMSRPNTLPQLVGEIHRRVDADVYFLTLLGARPEAKYDLDAVFAGLAAADRAVGGRLVPVLFAGADGIIEMAREAGVAAIADSSRALTAVAKLSRVSRRMMNVNSSSEADSAENGRSHRSFSEPAAKELLHRRGIPTSLGSVVSSGSQVPAEMTFPVAVKVVSADIMHKTDVGGVRLGVEREELDGVITEMLAAVSAREPQALLEGCLVEPMAAQGIDTIIGVHRDPALGLAVMFGLGGVEAELFRDVSFRVPPIDRATAIAMIEETRAGTLLAGWRGAVPCDIDALVETLVATSEFVLERGEQIVEFEMNPVRVHEDGHGVTVLDVVLIEQAELQVKASTLRV